MTMVTEGCPIFLSFDSGTIDDTIDWYVDGELRWQAFNIAIVFTDVGDHLILCKVTRAGVERVFATYITVVRDIRPIIYVSGGGTGDGTSADRASSLDAAFTNLKPNTRVLLKRGDISRVKSRSESTSIS